jgi:hypothetical protein
LDENNCYENSSISNWIVIIQNSFSLTIWILIYPDNLMLWNQFTFRLIENYSWSYWQIETIISKNLIHQESRSRNSIPKIEIGEVCLGQYEMKWILHRMPKETMVVFHVDICTSEFPYERWIMSMVNGMVIVKSVWYSPIFHFYLEWNQVVINWRWRCHLLDRIDVNYWFTIITDFDSYLKALLCCVNVLGLW